MVGSLLGLGGIDNSQGAAASELAVSEAMTVPSNVAVVVENGTIRMAGSGLSWFS
jgi:hypothetical protein